MSTFCDENICWFNVSVDDAFGVSGFESIGNLNTKRQQQFDCQWASSDAVFQSHAIKKLHGNEGLIPMFADLINCTDIGVIQRRGSSCLPAKTFQSLRIMGKVFWKKLKRNKTP